MVACLESRICAMQGGKTQFNIDWLNCKDKEGILLKTCCEPNLISRYSVNCYLCKKTNEEILRSQWKILQNSLPFSKKFLGDCRCFGPKNRTENWTVHAIKSIALKLPIDLDVDLLADEWRVYQLDEIPEEYYLVENSTIEEPVYKRVDHYWRKVLNHRLSTGELKYPLLAKVTKACLLVSHGNSDVERGFSESGRNVTTDRVRFSEESDNAICTTTDGLKQYGNQPHLVPITREFLSMTTKAHANYIHRLEEAKRLQKKKQKEDEERLAEEETRKGIKETMIKESKELKSVEKDIAAREDSQYLDMDVGTSLFKEANDKLKKALNENFFEKK